MQIPIVLRTRRLAGEPHIANVSTEILVALQRQAGRPVGVGAVRPGGGAPAWVVERDRIWDVIAVHLAEGDHDLGLGGFVILVVDAVGLIGDDSYEEEAGAGKEIFVIEGLPDRVVAAAWRGVEEEFGGFVPEDLVGWELEEDLGVDAHLEGLDGLGLPGGEGWGEGDIAGLQDTNGEGRDGVVGLDAGAVGGVDRDVLVGVGDVSHRRGEEEAWVVGLEELRGLAVEEGVVASVVKYEVVDFGETVVR